MKLLKGLTVRAWEPFQLWHQQLKSTTPIERQSVCKLCFLFLSLKNWFTPHEWKISYFHWHLFCNKLILYFPLFTLTALKPLQDDCLDWMSNQKAERGQGDDTWFPLIGGIVIVSVKRSAGYSSNTLRVLVDREDILISSYSGLDHPEMIKDIRSVIITSPAPVIFKK